MKRTRIIGIVLLAAMLDSCWGGGSGAGSNSGAAVETGGTEQRAPVAQAAEPGEVRHFPELSVPAVYGSNTPEAREYVLQHYWDAFFKSDGVTTPKAILGIPDEEVEQALANYINILQAMKLLSTPDEPEPFRNAQRGVRRMFSKLETKQQADTSAKTYLRFTEMVSKYLYDPNSPMRDEDFYLPFVEGMAASPCTKDNMRTAARFEASQCRKNGFGQVVPDFSYKDAAGNKGSLHAIHADYTMLFFSNPGCNSCKEIIDDIRSCLVISPMIQAKRLSIINIYIDEEVQLWRDYLHNYPSEWINGYDYTFSLRSGGGYDIRAIPSLYLLDSHKRVLMKDAPTAKVLSYLQNIYNQ